MEIDLEKTLPIADKSFDAVLCFNLLEHVFNFESALREIFRILRKNYE